MEQEYCAMPKETHISIDIDRNGAWTVSIDGAEVYVRRFMIDLDSRKNEYPTMLIEQYPAYYAN